MKYQIINGQLLPTDKALIPLNDLGLLRSYSIFDFFRVIDGVPVFIDDHLTRFLNSAIALDMNMRWTKAEIRDMCFKLISSNAVDNAGLRIIATGGYSTDGYTPSQANVYMMMHTLPAYPVRDFTHGRKMITSNYTRDMPEVKTTLYVHAIQHQQRMEEQKAIEILYHTDGVITEGSRSNIFFVDQNDLIITPSDAILRGITRKHVMHIAREKYQVVERTVYMNDIAEMKEAFMTSSTKGVLPIIAIEDVEINACKVGAVSTDLHDMFNTHISEYVKAHQND